MNLFKDYWNVFLSHQNFFLGVQVHFKELPKSHPILATANMVIRRRGPFAQDCACAEWILLWHVRKLILVSIDIIHRRPQNSWFYFKKAQVSWMCFIILNDLYMAHHNSLGICRQLKIHHLYGTCNFSTQCICMGTGSLLVYRFSSFSWKGAPSTKENRICGSVNCTSVFARFLRVWWWCWYQPHTPGGGAWSHRPPRSSGSCPWWSLLRSGEASLPPMI